ncbi:hypothetical protein [Actinophytocola sp.]|uniref:hypothetical protein n=1 Tax=Actinophytocola sp. TaxID=1872138 RepID=UPI002D8107E3|nr:hypothetical protein [Actinophytocola sp.]HET9143051.1 hypothetical protein [Actinophytocola sp.]
MTSLESHERRITKLEGRVTEVETHYGESIYNLRREHMETRLGVREILDRLGLPRITQEQVDEALDEE